MVAARARLCRVCTAPLPPVVNGQRRPIPRYHVCEECGFEPSPVIGPDGVWRERGPQYKFLSLSAPESFCDEVFFGGTVGGGKSQVLLMDATRYVDKPWYRALLLRRTMPELARTLIDRAQKIYGKIAPGGFVGSPRPMWRFPSGAQIHFGYMQYDADAQNYDGTEWHYVGFDELQHFTEYQYNHLRSRMRSSDDIPIRLRATGMPPESGEAAWVLRRFAPWIDKSPDYHGVQAASGEVLYFIGSHDAGEKYVPRGTVDEVGGKAKGRTFVLSSVFDNPYLDESYISTLLALDPVSRARFLYGDWSAMDKPGAVWQRAVINAGRVTSHPTLYRIGIGLDPSGSHRKGSDEAGIVAAGVGPCFCTGQREDHVFVFEDGSGVLPARRQCERVIGRYHQLMADFVLAEINYGGEWIKTAIQAIEKVELDDGTVVSGANVNVEVMHVSKGKVVRAEPVAALYGKLVDTPDGKKLEGCKVHHVGTLPGLENQQCTYDPRESIAISPGRMDALVFVVTKLLLSGSLGVEGVHSTGSRRFADRGGGFMT